MRKFFQGCIHEPKVVIKVFGDGDDEEKYALCKDCTLLKPFNQFLKDTIHITSKNKRRLSFVTLDVKFYYWKGRLC